MLNQNHCHIVALLCVRDAHKWPCGGLQHDGLIVEDPITNVVISFFGENIRRVPGFGQARTEPSSRCATSKFFDRGSSFFNVDALVGNFLHVLLAVTMPDKFPSALARSLS